MFRKLYYRTGNVCYGYQKGATREFFYWFNGWPCSLGLCCSYISIYLNKPRRNLQREYWCSQNWLYRCCFPTLCTWFLLLFINGHCWRVLYIIVSVFFLYFLLPLSSSECVRTLDCVGSDIFFRKGWPAASPSMNSVLEKRALISARLSQIEPIPELCECVHAV